VAHVRLQDGTGRNEKPLVKQREQADSSSRRDSVTRFIPLFRRTHPHEILDEGDHPHEELYGTFEDMRRVNRFLGGTSITLRGIERLTGHLQPGSQFTVADIGTGHADIPRAVGSWAERRGLACKAFGVDLDVATLITASRLPENNRITFLQGNMLQLPFDDRSVDIVMSSMTLHHFEDQEAVAALEEMARVSRLGIIINDLNRTIHGYAVAWLLGRLATKNRLTRHDAHRSILRGRTEQELKTLAREAGLQPPVFDSTLGYRTAMTVGVRPW
jgi:ubiquinone/menaquinone biosynthesis C-methylase UbiE